MNSGDGARCPRCNRWLADPSGATRVKCHQCGAHVLMVPKGQYGAVVYFEVKEVSCGSKDKDRVG